jgi:hypothetical protein
VGRLSFIAIEFIVSHFYKDVQKRKITVFCDMTPIIPVERNLCFGRICCLQGTVRMEGHVSTRHGYFYTRLQSDTSQKTVTFMFTTMGPSKCLYVCVSENCLLALLLSPGDGSKCINLTGIHSITSQRTLLFIFTAVRTSDLMSIH